jgi:integrase
VRTTAQDSKQLPLPRLHDLRHPRATILLSGVPVHVVTTRIGHADPALTHRVYAHVIRSAQVAADNFTEAVKVRRSPFVERVTRSTAEVRDRNERVKYPD